MQWRGRRRSANIRDARGQRVAGGAGGVGLLLNVVTRLFGIKGLIALAVLGFAGWQLGLIDPAALLGGGELREVDYQATAQEQEQFEFVSVVLADAEVVWTEQFDQMGLAYRPPELVVFRDQYPTQCGLGDARVGPFYCPADRRIYIDLRFFDELARSLQAPGDFAQAYVVAHEVAHHVQNLLGITAALAERRGEPDFNQHSVRLELHADFLAGVWASQNRQYLEQGDIQEAMLAANQIGDDAIQKRTQGKVIPHAFTHGTSE
jgi:predicted metalloprotease